jgi:hypothetical protein
MIENTNIKTLDISLLSFDNLFVLKTLIANWTLLSGFYDHNETDYTN